MYISFGEDMFFGLIYRGGGADTGISNCWGLDGWRSFEIYLESILFLVGRKLELLA